MSAPATAILFAAIAPLLGAVIVWTLLVLIPTLAEVKDVGAVLVAVTEVFPGATADAYINAAIPAAITGLLVALLSPFAATREQFLAGVAPIGALTIYIEAAWFRPEHAFPTPLFLAIVGAGTAILCALAAHQWPLARTEGREARRDRLSRERAARLKAARVN